MDKGETSGEGERLSGEWHIRAEGLRKRYPKADKDAVHDVSLEIRRGAVFGLLGPNGAGKTTTLSMLSGLIEPDSGSIWFAGNHSPKQLKHRIGFVPQNLALYYRLTARENLAFFGQLYGVKGAKLKKRSEELLEVAGLADRADERVERYSTGMQRRLNLVIGLLHDPEIVLLDEPTVGIDPQSRNRIFELVLELGGRGVTTLYTTHYMEEASLLCDCVAIMDHGKVLLKDSPKAMVERIGQYRVDLAVKSPPEALSGQIREMEGVSEVSLDETLLTATISEHEAVMALVQAVPELAERYGVVIKLRRVVEPSLESVFLSLTGRMLRDEVE